MYDPASLIASTNSNGGSLAIHGFWRLCVYMASCIYVYGARAIENPWFLACVYIWTHDHWKSMLSYVFAYGSDGSLWSWRGRLKLCAQVILLIRWRSALCIICVVNCYGTEVQCNDTSRAWSRNRQAPREHNLKEACLKHNLSVTQWRHAMAALRAAFAEVGTFQFRKHSVEYGG